MLKTETIARIATLAKVKQEDLVAAIADEKEVDFTIDEKLSVLSESEVATLKKNTYDDGKKAGVEIGVKDAKEKLGLDFQGKTIDGLIEAATKKALVDAKIPEAEKVKELQEKLTTAQATATDMQTKLAEKETEIHSVKTQGMIVKELPVNTTLPSDKVLLLMKADGYEYKNEEGKIVWHKDGKALTDKLGNNLTTKDVATEYVTTNKLVKEEEGAPGGRGAGDKKPPATFSSLSEVKQSFEKSGKSLLGSEFSETVAKAVAANKEFAMDK